MKIFSELTKKPDGEFLELIKNKYLSIKKREDKIIRKKKL